MRQEDESVFIDFIKDIAHQTNAPFPEKIFLSHDVRASVNYVFNHGSLFHPPKKYLIIGMGLINSITVEELKGILAHEFGHCSQKSAIPLYAYYFNIIIYNLLYKEDSYKGLQSMMSDSINKYINLISIISITITNVISWVLKRAYDLFLTNYMSFARKQEFDADIFSTKLTSVSTIKKYLLRFVLTQTALDTVLEYYDEKIQDNIVSPNIYKEQRFVMNFIANHEQIPIENELPLISLEHHNKFNSSKLIITNQWASHPSLEERFANLDNLFADSSETIVKNENLANTLFSDIESLQERITKKIYECVAFSGVTTENLFQLFRNDYESNASLHIFPEIYNEYYKNYFPEPFDLEISSPQLNPCIQIKDFYSESIKEVLHDKIVLEHDLNIIVQIQNKEIKKSSFDYDGKKYKRSECKQLISQLESRLDEMKEVVQKNDLAIFQYFYEQESQRNSASKLKGLYEVFFDFMKTYYESSLAHEQFTRGFQFICNQAISKDTRGLFKELKKIEADFKNKIEMTTSNENYRNKISEKEVAILENYISTDLSYFGITMYDQENIDILNEAIQCFLSLLSDLFFKLKKELLEYQASLLKQEDNLYSIKSER